MRLVQGQFGTQKGEVIDASLDEVMLDFTENDENDQKASPLSPKAEDSDDEELEEETQIGEKYGLSTSSLLLIGLLAGGVVVLGGQFFGKSIRRADRF